MKEGMDKLTELLSELETIISTQKMISIGDWVDEENARKMTGLGKSTLYELRRSGKLSSSKLSKRKVYYRISDIEKLLDENEKLQ